MSQEIIAIKNLSASIDGKPILKNFNLTVREGEIHAIMGPNGAGKSTLAKVLAGHPSYEVTGGIVAFMGRDLFDMEPEERAHAGLFMSFQYPVEVPGVSNEQFLRTAVNMKRKSQQKEELSEETFSLLMEEKMSLMNMRPDLKARNVNEGFSGGEKKRNEILQMALLEPRLAILDETDSGLDIDALRIVADGVNTLMHRGMGLVLITHYQRLLNYISPHFIHVMVDGSIIQSGNAELAHELEEKGYDWIVPTGVITS
ncbi:MAG: Fe-S cluster assembly ATPase SufC [Chlamydiales bacterium]